MGVDDSQSNYARGGGLSLVGEKLANMAQSCRVPFEFHDAFMSGCKVKREHLGVEPRFAVIVNFPYVLHHMPDESVSVENHRDRLLHLIKSLSPKLVTLVEQESNTNTSPLDYYTAMFESIDAAWSRDDKQRISAEQHCVRKVEGQNDDGWVHVRVRCLQVMTKTINLEGVKEHSISFGREDPWLHVLLGSQTQTRLCRTWW